MIGRVCPCHVARIAAGTGRVRVFLTTSPEIWGKVSVAFDMQALLSSARLLVAATSVSDAANAIIFICIRSPDTSRMQADNTRFAETGNMADIDQRKIGKTGHGNSRQRNTRRRNPKNVDAAARLPFTPPALRHPRPRHTDPPHPIPGPPHTRRPPLRPVITLTLP